MSCVSIRAAAPSLVRWLRSASSTEAPATAPARRHVRGAKNIPPGNGTHRANETPAALIDGENLRANTTCSTKCGVGSVLSVFEHAVGACWGRDECYRACSGDALGACSVLLSMQWVRAGCVLSVTEHIRAGRHHQEFILRTSRLKAWHATRKSWYTAMALLLM